MAQIRVAPNTANEVLLTADQLIDADFSKTHTGLSDYESRIQPTDLHSLALEELWLEEDDGTLLFRGQLQKIDEQEKPPETLVSGEGIGYKLEQSETVFNVSNELAHNAIERFWNDETPFNPTVTAPSVNNSVTGEQAQEADTNSEFNDITDISDTDPLAVQNDNIELLDTSYTFEGENDNRSRNFAFSDNGSFSSGQAAIIGTAFPQWIEWDFSVPYTIPAEDFGIHLRRETSGLALPALSWKLDGEEISTYSAGGNLGWTTTEIISQSGSQPSSDVSAGSHTLRVEVDTEEVTEEQWTANVGTFVNLSEDDIQPATETVTDGDGAVYARTTDYEMDYDGGRIKALSGGDITDGADLFIDYEFLDLGDEFRIDVVQPFDTGDRYDFGPFSYTYDNDNGGSGGYLDGPEFYPDEFILSLTEEPTSWNITDGTLSTSWDDTTNNQRIQLRLNGQTWFPNDGTENNTSSVTTDFGSEVGSAIQGRASLSRYGSTTGQTPLTGINGQKIQSWEITFDGDDTPVFGTETFEGTDLEVAQQMHSRADMRYTLEHEKNSLPVESYRPEDNTKSLPALDVINETTRTDYGNFANHITVRGQTEDDNRLSHTVQDDTSVNNLGVVHYDAIDPSLKSLVEIKVKARALLREKLRERNDKGEKEVVPIDIAPGYNRTSPFGGDDIPIEEVSYRISNGDISGRLIFDYRTGERLAGDISGLRNKGRNNSLGF